MTTNEETIAMGDEKKEVKKNNASREWKNVAIGGVSGIMFGAGTAYAANKLVDDDEHVEDGNYAVKHDTSVDSSDVATVKAGQSFGEAFADARAQVGAGGVFRWHDGVYGTYLKDEWDALSPEEQQQFTKNAMNAAKDTGNGSVVHVSMEEIHDSANVESNTATTVFTDPHVEEPTSEPNTKSASKPFFVVNNNQDVHVVGTHDDQLASGNAVTVGLQDGESLEKDVLVVNLDDDATYGVEASEFNDCCKIEEDETMDISSMDAGESNTEMNMNLYTSNDVTSDMSDCASDVDVQLA